MAGESSKSESVTETHVCCTSYEDCDVSSASNNNVQKQTDSVTVNKSMIKETGFHVPESLLSVTVYNESEFEAGVLEQLTSAFKKKVQREIYSLKRRIVSADDDLKIAQADLEKMEQSLDELLCKHSVSPDGILNPRKIRTLELEIENKMNQIDVLTSRKKVLESKITTMERRDLQFVDDTGPNDFTTHVDFKSAPSKVPVLPKNNYLKTHLKKKNLPFI